MAAGDVSTGQYGNGAGRTVQGRSASPKCHQLSGPDGLLDAPTVLDIGHHDLHRPHLDQPLEEVGPVTALSASHRHSDAGGDLGQGGRVFGGLDRLLEPSDIEPGKLFGDGRSGVSIKPRVAVDQQGDISANGAPNRSHSFKPGAGEGLQIGVGDPWVHLVERGTLYRPEAVAYGSLRRRGKCAGLPVCTQQPPVGVRVQVDGGDRSASQRLRQRHSVTLRLDIHERGPQGAHGSGQGHVLAHLLSRDTGDVLEV